MPSILPAPQASGPAAWSVPDIQVRSSFLDEHRLDREMVVPGLVLLGGRIDRDLDRDVEARERSDLTLEL